MCLTFTLFVRCGFLVAEFLVSFRPIGFLVLVPLCATYFRTLMSPHKLSFMTLSRTQKQNVFRVCDSNLVFFFVGFPLIAAPIAGYVYRCRVR